MTWKEAENVIAKTNLASVVFLLSELDIAVVFLLSELEIFN